MVKNTAVSAGYFINNPEHFSLSRFLSWKTEICFFIWSYLRCKYSKGTVYLKLAVKCWLGPTKLAEPYSLAEIEKMVCSNILNYFEIRRNTWNGFLERSFRPIPKSHYSKIAPDIIFMSCLIGAFLQAQMFLCHLISSTAAYLPPWFQNIPTFKSTYALTLKLSYHLSSFY